MANVIKTRQLPNGDKHTPKSDFILNVRDDSTALTSPTYNINGTVKLAKLDVGGTQIDHYNYESVGKGQWAILRPSPTVGAQLRIYDRNSGLQVGFFALGIDNGSGGWPSTEIKKAWKFLGQVFKNQGNNDRWIITNSQKADGLWRAGYMINLDTLETFDPYEAETTGSGDGPYYDFTCDGTNIYNVYWGTGDLANRRIQKFNIQDLWDKISGGNWSEGISDLLDDAGEQVKVNRIYGITETETGTDKRLICKSVNNNRLIYNFSNSTVEEAANPMLNIAMVPAGEMLIQTFDKSQAFIESTSEGTSIKTRSGATLVALPLDTDEIILGVIDYIHTEDVSTEMHIVLYSNINKNIFIRKIVIDWATNGYTDTAPVTQALSGTAVEAYTYGYEKLFSNSCNSYAVGKFYDYNLQKQWEAL